MPTKTENAISKQMLRQILKKR